MAESGRVIEHAGRPVADVKKGFAAAVARAGLPPWVTPHVLKHSVVSWLAEDGVTADRIADLTATDERTVRRIYRKVNPAATADLAEALAAGVLGAEVPTQSAPSSDRRAR